MVMFAVEVGAGKEKHKIRTLEKSLEDEKRRLAAMEMELRDAKKQRGAEQQLSGMRKQSKALQTMMGTLSSSARKEHAERREWEDEWRHKFDDFHRQHREMEEALKRRHFQELKALQEDIQRGVRKVAGEVSKSQGRKMPSPRSLKRLQESNMEGLVMMFHKHGQERLFLANKLAKQVLHHPGGNPGENLKSISHRCYLREVTFELELTGETMYLPLGCLQGGSIFPPIAAVERMWHM